MTISLIAAVGLVYAGGVAWRTHSRVNTIPSVAVQRSISLVPQLAVAGLVACVAVDLRIGVLHGTLAVLLSQIGTSALVTKMIKDRQNVPTMMDLSRVNGLPLLVAFGFILGASVFLETSTPVSLGLLAYDVVCSLIVLAISVLAYAAITTTARKRTVVATADC